MKKRFLITLLGLILVLSSCGKKENESVKETTKETDVNTTEETQKENTPENDNSDMSGEVTYEKLMSIPPTPLEEFEWSNTPEGDIALGVYKGENPMVYIADEYEGKKVVKISGFAYNHNPYVKAIRLGKNLRLLEKSVFGTNKVLEIFVSEGLEVIEKGAFNSAKALRDVRLNEGLKEIHSGAFGFCSSLKELTIPKSIESITPGAFLNSHDMVIKGYAGTPTKEAAESSNIKYEEIKE